MPDRHPVARDVLLYLLFPHVHGVRVVDCWQAFRPPRPAYSTMQYHLQRLCAQGIVVVWPVGPMP